VARRSVGTPSVARSAQGLNNSNPTHGVPNGLDDQKRHSPCLAATKCGSLGHAWLTAGLPRFERTLRELVFEPPFFFRSNGDTAIVSVSRILGTAYFAQTAFETCDRVNGFSPCHAVRGHPNVWRIVLNNKGQKSHIGPARSETTGRATSSERSFSATN
jgi:hypothetical protein